MFNCNVALLTGRLGAEPEVRVISSGKVASFSLAVDQNFKNGAGKWQTVTHWFDVVTYQPWLIDNVLSGLGPGNQVFVHANLRYRTWEQGGIARNAVELLVDNTGGITPVTGDSTPMNMVMLAGRLGDHATIKTLPGKDGSKVASFSMAVDRGYRDREGKWVTQTDWLRVVTFQPSLIVKTLAKQATKGRLVIVQGALRWRQWDQDGEKRTSVEIEVDGAGSITPVLEDRN